MLTILVFFAGLDSDEYSGMFFVCKPIHCIEYGLKLHFYENTLLQIFNIWKSECSKLV